MKKFILIQHCQSEHHINNMSGGWTDTPLTPLGIKQAHIIGEKLKSISWNSPCTLYSSDLLRASQTATIIGNYLNLNVSLVTALREINTGIAINQTKDWANAHRNPQTTGSFDLDYLEFDQGETWRQFYTRICNCINNLTHVSTENIIIVSHGCALAYIIAWWLQFTPEMLSNAFFCTSPGSISILSENTFKQHTLALLNDVSHFNILK